MALLEKMFTVDEVAEMASVTSRTVRNYIKEGKLHGHKLGGQWRFPEAEVQRLLYGGAESSAAPAEPSSKASAPIPEQPFLNEVKPEPVVPEPQPAAPETPDPTPYIQPQQQAPAATAVETTAVPDPPAASAAQVAAVPDVDAKDTANNTPPADPGMANTPSIPPSTLPHTDAPVQKKAEAPQHTIPVALSGLPSSAPPAAPAPVAPPQPTFEEDFLVPEDVKAFIQPYQQSDPNISPAAADEAFYSSLLENNSISPETAYRPSSSYQQIAPGSAPQEESATPEPAAPAKASSSPPAASHNEPAAQYNIPVSSRTPLPSVSKGGGRQSRGGVLSNFELSDVGKRVAQFTSEVHDCSNGAQICMVYDVHQSLAAAKITSDKIVQTAAELSTDGIPCLSFVEFDARYYIARYTLFGSSAFLKFCLDILGG